MKYRPYIKTFYLPLSITIVYNTIRHYNKYELKEWVTHATDFKFFKFHKIIMILISADHYIKDANLKSVIKWKLKIIEMHAHKYV